MKLLKLQARLEVQSSFLIIYTKPKATTNNPRSSFGCVANVQLGMEHVIHNCKHVLCTTRHVDLLSNLVCKPRTDFKCKFRPLI